MNKNLYILVIVLAGTLLNSCKKSSGGKEAHCEKLVAALSANNTAEIKKEIENQSRRLGIIKTGATFDEVREMLEKLAASINKDCAINASVACTMCIYTLPAQSEIRLTVPGNNNSHYILDLYTNEREIITFVGLHKE